ncbi:hypothetical protein PR202_ga07546 [Eleusine coracana subsp. coracana]|uniref:Uncharacterized protein n=1 Tax=Eleusine coracana subsp. coracana TaxID=191504 RepID=A0AAV5BZI2_ELECO|nr:hypothetical protein PR202_ga07546 [Eleusine coracana subsp. coracana]
MRRNSSDSRLRPWPHSPLRMTEWLKTSGAHLKLGITRHTTSMASFTRRSPHRPLSSGVKAMASSVSPALSTAVRGGGGGGARSTRPARQQQETRTP